MSALTDDLAGFVAKRDEAAAALEAALTELAPAREAVRVAKAEALAASRRFNSVVARVNHAIDFHSGGLGETSPVLGRVIAEARAVKNEVDTRCTRAQNRLSDVEWRVSCLRDDVFALDRLISPGPPGGRLPELVRRGLPPGPSEVEVIEFRDGRSDAAQM